MHLDGIRGYGSGFLHEVFAGLIEKCGITHGDTRRNLGLVTENTWLAKEIMGYIADAQQQGITRESLERAYEIGVPYIHTLKMMLAVELDDYVKSTGANQSRFR